MNIIQTLVKIVHINTSRDLIIAISTKVVYYNVTKDFLDDYKNILEVEAIYAS